MANPTLNTRIKIKNDISTNWAKATGFIPLKGEIIYYNDIHKFKVGDGSTAVTALSFIDSNIYSNPTLTASNGCFTWTISTGFKPNAVNIFTNTGEQVLCDVNLTSAGATIKMYRTDVTNLTSGNYYAYVR